MRKFGLLGTSALRSSIFIGFAVAAATPGYAQVTAADEQPDETQIQSEVEAESDTNLPNCAPGDTSAECTSEQIVVTGSRIRRPNLESNVPVTSVGPQELLDQGSTQLGDALNDLPSLRSTFNSSNSQRFIGTTGLSLLDLRGLGTTRTLVLVNGRRHVTSSAGDFRVDVNTIPQELLERVDVVTGGNSAVYGSDAIAGVVNFVLKRDFEGLEGRAQGSISDRGDRGAYFASLTAGRNFADGRGNLAVTAEYSRTNAVYNIQRPQQSGSFIGFTGFINTDIDPAGAPDDGIPDNTLQNNVRYNFISEGGTLTTFCFGSPASQPLACDPFGQAYFYRFDPTGRLVRDNGITRDFRREVAGSSFALGGSGSTLSDSGTLFPDIERFSANLLSHFDVSPAFRPFFEAKFARLKTYSESSPTFLNSFCNGLRGLGGIDTCAVSSSVPIRLDNPFLNPADATLIRNIQRELLRAGGLNPDLPANTPTFFRLNRNNLDLGVREENSERDTWRVVGGVEGDFNDDWRYEVSATYGRYESELRSGNNVINARLQNALDSVRAPNGNIVCRINADASTTNDDAACAPLNPFGFGAPSQAAVNYVTTTSLYQERASQLDVLGFVGGDLSQLFELPGGPVRFVLGAEYRRERAKIIVDEQTRTGQTFLTALVPFDPPTLGVVEGFGELQIPLLRDMPFFHELEVNAAARYSDYDKGAGNTNKTLAYNFGVTWSPIRDIRFRANYSQSVRSPTPSNLFAAQGQNFAFLTDPCDARNIANGGPQRVANCRSATRLGNVPTDYIQPSGNRSILQGGNPLLKEETSKSLTIGTILQPRFLPGFSLTVDYYDIEVEDVIATLSGNAILSQCYDSDNFPNNGFCDLVGDRQPGGFLNATAAVTVSSVNFAKLVAQGIDFDAAYRKTFGNGDRLSLRAIATYNLKRNNFLDVLNPTVPNRVKSELGDPEWAANFNGSYRHGIATLSYSLRYLGKQTIGTYESQHAFNGNPPTNPDAYAEVNYPDRFYHDVRLELQPVEAFRFYVGIDNVTDKLPPFGLTGAGEGSGIFDNIGRTYYAGTRFKF